MSTLKIIIAYLTGHSITSEHQYSRRPWPLFSKMFPSPMVEADLNLGAAMPATEGMSGALWQRASHLLSDGWKHLSSYMQSALVAIYSNAILGLSNCKRSNYIFNMKVLQFGI